MIKKYNDFKTTYKGGIYREWYQSVKDIYVTPQIKEHFTDWPEYITKIQWDNIKTWDFFAVKRILGANVTSSICVIWSILHDPVFVDNYEIWFTGLDIEREEMMRVGDPWKNTKHKDAGKVESDFLRSSIESGILKYLNDEKEYFNFNTSEKNI